MDDSCQSKATEDNASCPENWKCRGLIFLFIQMQNLVELSDFLAYTDVSQTKGKLGAKNLSLAFLFKSAPDCPAGF